MLDLLRLGMRPCHCGTLLAQFSAILPLPIPYTPFCSFGCFQYASSVFYVGRDADNKKPLTFWVKGFLFGCGSRICHVGLTPSCPLQVVVLQRLLCSARCGPKAYSRVIHTLGPNK